MPGRASATSFLDRSAFIAMPAAGVPVDPGHRTASLRDRLRDHIRYQDLLSRSFWWYMFTHVMDMWPSYRARWQKAASEGPVSVSSPRAFFTAMRVTGMSGRFYVLGGSGLKDDLVVEEFRAAFDRYFDGPGIGAREREAFERFIERTRAFNPANRAHANMHKNLRDPLIKASTMRPDQIANYFDSLTLDDKVRATREFQSHGELRRIREEFLAVLRKTLEEEDPAAPDRVRAGIVMGSFASGAAGPGSDFDVELLVNGAERARIPAFSKRLTDRWIAAGRHAMNPVSAHERASWPSWGIVNVVHTRYYLVVSPEPALEARLSRQAFESPGIVLERGYTLRGSVNRVVQRAIVASATVAADALSLWGAPAAGARSAPRPTLRECLHYSRLWLEQLWFYLVTNIVSKWGDYSADWRRLRASGAPPVSRPRGFFAHMRVMGETGAFSVPGFLPRADEAVMQEARETFDRYFDGPGIGPRERAAFEGFLQRAVVYNAARRAASKFRASVRDAMLKASVTPADQIAALFDGLPLQSSTAEFQKSGAADALLARFREIALEEIEAEPAGAHDRVTGVVLIGSFVLGAATPTSDFDAELVTADGTSGRVQPFIERVLARWSAEDRQKANPITFHKFAHPESRWEIHTIHHEPYLVISPNQSIVDDLSRRASEPVVSTPSRELTRFGVFLRGLQYAAVYLTSLFTPSR